MNDYLEFTKQLATDAAEIAMRYFSFEVENTWKADNSPLTMADTEINDLVINRVNEKYPEHSIYGEEKCDIKPDSKYIWVCDPIDGTMPFSNGLPMFTFSIALVDQSDGQPILGLVNDPMMKNMYWACKGDGAFRNGQKISVSKQNTLDKSYVSFDGTTKKNIILQQNMSKKGCKTLKLCSIVYGAIQVANGKFVGTVFYNEFAHDVAALKIITEEAGGKVTDLFGNERRYDQDGPGCVISNGILHNEILECVADTNK